MVQENDDELVFNSQGERDEEKRCGHLLMQDISKKNSEAVFRPLSLDGHIRITKLNAR
jgi:hypothetical protein